MRIVVISDSHRKYSAVEKIIRAQPEAQHIFFLGDVTSDIEDLVFEYPDKKFYIVSGNCDFNSSYSYSDIAKIGDISIFYTHGHSFGVKSTTARLAAAARERGCKIALYGHTHIPYISYDDGLYIVNPGSCSSSRGGPNSYAVIDITEKGIMPIIMPLTTKSL